ncbi:matrixin family metalloprotease [bacterium]|nr:matrixin family metalloprotease [bacterium]
MKRYKHLLLAAVVIALLATGASAYVLLPFNWAYLGGSPVTVSMYVNPNCADPSAVDELASLLSAMDSWSNANADFAFNYAGYTSVTNFNYFNFQNDICWNPGSSGGALATTSMWFYGGNMSQADVVFWDVHTWRTGTTGSNQYDVETVGVHELGHVVGLDHTPISAAVMYYAIGWWETKRTLHSDDIAGIQAIYGMVGGPDLTATVTATSSVNLPGSGGSIDYDLSVHNNTGSTQIFDGWTGIEQVGGGYSEEFIVRTGLNLGGGLTIFRALSIYIASTVPNGTYDYYLRVGDYSWNIIDEDSFEFYKYGDFDGIPVENSYTTWWDDGAEGIVVVPVVPDHFQVSSVYPNPFNPETTIAFDLPEASHVSLQVYNVNGQLVSDLLEGSMEAGAYKAAWNASSQPSGTYLYRLTSDLGTVSGKMVLVK